MMTDTLTTQLPVAVYGTLRVGYGNHRILAGRVSDITLGTIDGYELVVDGLPYARRSSSGQLVAEVMWLLPHIYDQTLADLDRLEGFHPDRVDNFYHRTEVTVTIDSGDVQAWLYEAGAQTLRRLGAFATAVPSGDYSSVRRPVHEEAWA